MEITQFKGQYDFLSNFHPSPIQLQGMAFPTAEHAFQAMKTMDADERATIAKCPTPAGAKRMGRKVTLRPDWESVKAAVMHEVLMVKFQNPELAQMLRDTGDATLIEGNTWRDYYWGVCGGKGKNILGQLLMIVRGQI